MTGSNCSDPILDALATPEGLETGNLWLAEFRHETGVTRVSSDGLDIPLPKAAGNKVKGWLADPQLLAAAIVEASRRDPAAAKIVQDSLESSSPRGWVTIVAAAITATAAIVSGALGYVSSKNSKKAAKAAARAAELKAEAEKQASEALKAAEEEKTKQTAMLIAGGAAALLLVAYVVT